VIRGENVDGCSAASVAVRDTFRTRKVLREAGACEDRVRVFECRRIDAEVDDEVDVVGGTNLGRLALHRVEEHHLAADQQPVASELRGDR